MALSAPAHNHNQLCHILSTGFENFFPTFSNSFARRHEKASRPFLDAATSVSPPQPDCSFECRSRTSSEAEGKSNTPFPAVQGSDNTFFTRQLLSESSRANSEVQMECGRTPFTPLLTRHFLPLSTHLLTCHASRSRAGRTTFPRPRRRTATGCARCRQTPLFRESPQGAEARSNQRPSLHLSAPAGSHR